MSALTFEILSTELTLALSKQSDTPPDTTARCNLGRDKVMVLVEYPLDSAQAEPMASQTLNWLEAHLRHQFDTTGLPEEAAELAEAGEEVPVQLFLKHRSEPKPFTMRSFIWKVDDGFDDIFGDSFEAARVAAPQPTSEAASATPVFRHPSEVLADSKLAHSDTSSDTSSDAVDLPVSDLPSSALSNSEGHNAGFHASEFSEPVPSELDEEHLLLDLEPDLDLDLAPDLAPDLGSNFEADLSTDIGSTALNFENYLDTPAPQGSDPQGSDPQAPDSQWPDLEDPDPEEPDLSHQSEDDPLDIEAEFLPTAPSTVSSSVDLDDLSAGLTYPLATPPQQADDTGAAFDADLAAGVTSNPFTDASSTEFSLPGEAPTITSSEFDLPTVDLPVASDRETSTSGDFFTFDSSEAEATSTNVQTEAEDLDAEIAFSPSTPPSQPTLEDDLSVEFGLSPEEAPPAVYNADLAAPGVSDIAPETNPHSPEVQSPQVTESQAAESQAAESQVTESQATNSTTDEDELHLFDLPTAAEPLSTFDLPAAESQSQDDTAETIEDYLPTDELPSDDLSQGDLLAEELDLVENDNLDGLSAEEAAADPLIAEVEQADDDAAGPPSLDLSPLAYHILADEVDDEASEADRNERGARGDRNLADGTADATAYGLEGGAESRDANEGYSRESYSDEDYNSEDYNDEDYDSEDYEDDSTYYLEEDDDDYEEPLEDVALIDDGEVERQRDQWQQQSKSNPWVFVGALGLLVLGVLGFVFTRPCSFGARCDRIQTAQARGDEAIGNLRLDASLESVNTSKKELERAIQSLKPIPVWSPHHDDAQAILPEYEEQLDALDLVTKAQEQAYKAAVDSQNPPHAVSTWNGIAADWLAATQSLEAVPADSPVRELADRKLLEYRSNRATILVRIDAESKAEVSLRQSQQAATKATNLTQNAGTLQDWEDALAAWESAVDNLSQIPQGTNAHGEAQQILPGYLKQLEEVRDRTEQERSASRELFQAKQRAADAQRAESEDRWTIAAQNWKTALGQLQGIPQGTLAHSEAQALAGLYTSALNKAESNLQIALRFQPVEPEFFAACGATTAQKCTYSVRGGNVRLDLFQGYDSIIDQSITPPDQRVIVTAPNDQYVDQSNQLLKSITLLSTQAQVPIELYDAQGAFLARYRPDLNGFVREQG